jgi:hypothetical protein
MCTCDTDPRIRANHQNFPQNCEYSQGGDYAHPQGTTDPFGMGHYGESFTGYEGEFPQGHSEPYGVRTMDPWSTSFTGADDTGIDPSGSGDDGDAEAIPVTTLPTADPQIIVEQIAAPVSPRHVWRRRNGTTFSTIHGSPRDRRAKFAAATGRITRVSGSSMHAGCEFAGADPWGDLAPTCPPGKQWQQNMLQCVPFIPPPQPEQLAALHPAAATKGYYAGADPWGDLTPTCPTGQTWAPNSLQCVRSIPQPQPEQLASLHPAATKGDFTGWGMGDFVYPGGFPEYGYGYPGFWVGAAAATVAPVAQAQAHADNAKSQAQSAKEVAQHPAANAPAKKAANASMAHATQAHAFARAAASNPARAAHYAHEAGRHATASALEARRAHGHLHQEHGRGGVFENLFGRGRGGGRGRGFGRGGRSRFFHSEWRGVGHPNWRRGIGARWRGHRAECVMPHRYGCLKERCYSPEGYLCYRVTPAGLMQGVQLEAMEQAANVQYVQASGQQPPTADDGLLPGSEQSADGSKTPEEGEADGEKDTSSDDAVADDAVETDVTTADGDADTSDTTASGEFAGWDMFFTDPYGNYNQSLPAAWDSGYAYGPGYPWGGWNW